MAGLELQNVSVSKPVMLLTDTVTINFTVLNNTGARVRNLSANVLLTEKAFGVVSSAGSLVWLEVDKSVSIANGATQTFTYQFQPGTGMRNFFVKYPDVHIATAQLSVSTDYSDGTTEAVDQDVVQLYDGYYKISIDELELTRCINGVPNDEGESVLTDLRITQETIPGGPVPTMMLHYAEGDAVDESAAMIDLSAHITDAQAGLTAAQIISATFSNGSDWAFLLVLSNGYEAVSVRTTLGRAFANVHLSGASTGGVAFGKFSASQEGAPLFECAYPARMLGGIEGVNVYVEDEVLTGGRWINGKPLYRRTIVTTSSATGYTDINLSALGFDFLRIVDSTINFKYNGSGNYWGGTSWHNPTTDSAGYDFHRVYVTGTTLRLHTGSRVQRIAEYTTIEYTKAADAFNNN